MRRLGSGVGVATVAAVAVVVVAGCAASSPAPRSDVVPSPPASAAPPESGDAVAWADDYCGAMSELVRSVSSMPSVDASSPRRASETSGELLDVMVTGLERTLDRLGGLGAPPVAEAERLRRDAVERYSDIRDRAQNVLDELAAAEGPEARLDAVSAVSAPLDDIGGLNLLEGFDTVPALDRASGEAPSCLRLTGPETGGTPRFATPGS
ncbi:hypothetical protein FFT09_06005 [Saccharomonospora piscinae]|uniref:hypothetical protein n=1 Tax=Saccharomonospora piscinae TaxID=687388 RepID=UPI0011066A57|nr:hypothetical protein [Saccharomonospora piscinae]TLW92993.1 hypothetical protein FFT09_06005 [Saccharomonospora piscinae]